MIALLTTVLFAAAALLAAGTIAHAWRAYGHRFADFEMQLRQVEHGDTVRFARRQPTVASAVSKLRFTPRAGRLPYYPAQPLPVAA
jgi:hypothetical protein